MAYWKGIGLAIILSTALYDRIQESCRQMRLQNDHEMGIIFKNLKSKPYFSRSP